MSIPPFRDDGWLTEGHHPATWDEIISRFGGGVASKRSLVLDGLLAWRDSVRASWLSGLLILNGSFISRKSVPGDFEAIFVCDIACEHLMLENPTAKALTDYALCKERGLGDIVAFSESTVLRFPDFCRLDEFDLDKLGKLKGVLEVRI